MIRSLVQSAAAAALVAAVAAAAAEPGPSARPFVSLSATPARLTLLARVPETLVLHNDGTATVRVVARPESFAFDLSGNASVAPRREPARSARAWLRVRPRRVVLRPGQEGLLRVVARPPRGASPGDHHALILLSSQLPGRSTVAVRTRLGVLAFVRAAGPVRRRLAVVRVSARPHKRRIAVTVANRGNVTERIVGGDFTITLRRGRRALQVARARPRDILPGTRGVVVIRVRRGLRGRVDAVVRIARQADWTAGPAAPPPRPATKIVRLRL